MNPSNPANTIRRKRLKTGAVQIHADDLYLADADNLEAKLVLELATEIERSRNPEYVSVSYPSQIEAAEYFNANGFERTLEHMLKLRGEL